MLIASFEWDCEHSAIGCIIKKCKNTDLHVVWRDSSPRKVSLNIPKSLLLADTVIDNTSSTINHILERLSIKYVETKLYRPTHLAPLPWFTGNALKTKTRDRDSGNRTENIARRRKRGWTKTEKQRGKRKTDMKIKNILQPKHNSLAHNWFEPKTHN